MAHVRSGYLLTTVPPARPADRRPRPGPGRSTNHTHAFSGGVRRHTPGSGTLPRRDRVRTLLPELPLTGFDGIQIRDEIEFERWLVDAPR